MKLNKTKGRFWRFLLEGEIIQKGDYFCGDADELISARADAGDVWSVSDFVMVVREVPKTIEQTPIQNAIHRLIDERNHLKFVNKELLEGVSNLNERCCELEGYINRAKISRRVRKKKIKK